MKIPIIYYTQFVLKQHQQQPSLDNSMLGKSSV